ncbi:NAD-dependent epimerase/dehydratase family protein [Microbacterium sp. SSM24]|uniref:NAD-dependent epimerase/dehydratase family protein n=1 Tax=Microbacterium sp. SSM24 TaxID=2991714 RepID=UPI0022275891|nr:NAD-dependent epimerase/dehydratase family protein [Microbacterium sp. SSM24]MCW3491830.1 NAD-dependent epimerase/dehydratase family protein [Microbacterium sp. SSM24]
MATKRVLYIGGTGTISAACVRRSVAAGDEVTVLNRGSSRRPLPHGVRELVADVRDAAAVRQAVGAAEYDAVADFLSFTPAHVGTALDLFEGRTGQYVFLSSASAYEKPPRRLPVTESTPLRNPFWQYSRDKIACEDLLVAAHRERGLPVTIVRPSHTYDAGSIPTLGGWTDIARMRAGRPVVIHGDGTSLWTITHADDFAVAFAGLLGHPQAIGDAFTITGSHAPAWNTIYGWLADAAGVSSPDFVHVASDTIAAFAPELGPTLVGDKAHSMVFDNSKVIGLVPEFRTTILFDEGARRIVAHHDAHPELQRTDEGRDALFDRIAAHARSAG